MALVASLAAVGFTAVGLRGLIRLRSWGVLALGAACVLVAGFGRSPRSCRRRSAISGLLANEVELVGPTLAFALPRERRDSVRRRRSCGSSGTASGGRGRGRRGGLVVADGRDAHPVERPPDEDERGHQEDPGQDGAGACGWRPTASSTASSPNRVVNLMTGFMATDEVSLKGSPTVSPTTVAACSSVPFSLSSTSTIFFALSQAPPALAMKIAW